MNIVLFDDSTLRSSLLPFTYTRPLAEIRVGILTIKQKWEKHTAASCSYLTEPYLREKYGVVVGDDNLLINGSLCPDAQILEAIRNLQLGNGLSAQGQLLAMRCDKAQLENIIQSGDYPTENHTEYNGEITLIAEPWQIFKFNGLQIAADFDLITADRKSSSLADSLSKVYNEQSVFIEEGVKIKAAILNAESGPIYLGKNSTVEEGAIIRGPFALCEGSYVNMGAKMRGDTTIGPYSKVGGEVSNSVILGYSNKAHDGFLGNSVIGEWCNLGADTNTSNLKNNYANVKIWDFDKEGFKDTGEIFCGLMMGDHSKCGINTMFNTGTVVGVSANIFGSGFPRNFIPSFAWGGAAGFTTFQMAKVYDVAEKAMARRSKELTSIDKDILHQIFNDSAQNRIWEKK